MAESRPVDVAGPERAWVPLLGVAVAAALGAGFVAADLSPRDVLVSGLVLAAAGITLARVRPEGRLVLTFLSVLVSTRYIVWRATESLGGVTWVDIGASVLLFIAELYAFTSLLGGAFQTAAYKRRTPVPLDGLGDDDLPWVDVFIPSYNESVEVVRATAVGALSMSYPKFKVYILDDGRRASMRELAEEVGCHYLNRPDNKGAKAGNINAALKRTDGELIAIFDADHVPVRGFLQATVGFFLRDRRLALVQTPHHFVNPDPFERNLHLEGQVPPEQHYFYHTIQLGNDFWNSAFFCGSCAVLRRTALVEVGGVSTDTVTEDACTSLLMHARGWGSAYLDVPLAAGFATESFGAHLGQRVRWARGMAQIFRLHNPFLLPGLRWAQRINYACASWHFLGATPRVLFVLAAPAYLLFGIHPVHADVNALLCFAVPHLVLIWAGSASSHRNTRHSFWSEVYEIAIAPYTAAFTLGALVFSRHGLFKVTAKGETNETLRYDWGPAAPVLALLALSALAVGRAPVLMWAHPDDATTVLVAALWSIYNLALLLAAAAVALERPQRRASHRVVRSVPIRVTAGAVVAPGRSIDISLGGALLEVDALPEATEVEVHWDSVGAGRSVPAEVVQRRIEDGKIRVGVRWLPAGLEAQRTLIAAIYGDSDSWVGDRFPHDHPGRSAISVLLAPLAAALQGPNWVKHAIPARRDGHSLVPGTRAVLCPGCGRAKPHILGRCERCGTAIPAPGRDPAPMISAAEQWRGMDLALPALIASIALVLATGLDPWSAHAASRPVGGAEALERRVAELREAHDALRAMADDMRRRSLRGENPDPTWARRVERLRVDAALLGTRSRWPEVAEAEISLQVAALALDSASVEFATAGALERRLGGVVDSLNRAHDALEVD